MKKLRLICWLVLLMGLPLLLLACNPGTPGDSDTDTKSPEGTTGTPTEPSETTEELTEPVTEPETEATTTAPVTEPVTEPETGDEIQIPIAVLSAIRGSAKLTEEIDYADTANWISMPTNPDKAVDVFFIYPTFFGGTATEDIADIDNPEMRAGADLSLRGQASVFGDVCNIYMPAYRQLSVACLLNVVPRESVVQYYLSCDIYRALDYYFENCNNGRPFMLAGHSQGSIWVTEILENYMREHPEYLERMVASYAIGYSVTRGYMDANPHLKFAERADDTGVIISYNVEGPGNQNKFNCVVSSGSIAINPLTWTRDATYAPADLNPGSLNHNNAFEVGLADARVDTARGVVICDSVDPALYSMPATAVFGPQSYHYYDYSLYYVSLKNNVATRAQAYFAAENNG